MDVMNVSIGRQELAFAQAVARRFFREPQDAADAAQDALLTACRHLASFRGDAQLKTWLHRIVVNTALGLLRKRGRRPVAGSIDEAHHVASPEPSPEARVADAEVVARARDQVGALGAMYQEVLGLRVDQDLGDAEIAAALGVTVPTVKIRLHRARHAARQAIAL